MLLPPPSRPATTWSVPCSDPGSRTHRSFAAATESTTTTLDVHYDLSVADATFTWSTDETGATFDDNTVEGPELTHAATPGTYTLTCEISSATATDAPLTVTFDYEVVAA